MELRIIRRLLFITLLVGATIGLTATTAAAQTGQGGATITPDSAPANTDFTVSAGGFKPSSPVNATVDGFMVSHLDATAGSDGTVSIVFRSSEPGVHRVRLVGINPSDAPHGPSAAFTTRGALCTSNCSGGLPRTGRALGPLVLLGLVLVLGGIFMVTRDHIDGKHFKGAAKRHARVLGAAVLTGTLMAGAAQVANPPAARAAGTASIAGKATNGSTTNGVANVCVHAANASDFGMALTASDGTYTISNLAAGRYNVGFVDCSATPTFFTEYHGSSRNWRSATGIDLVDGQAATGKDAQLDAGGVVVGRVTAAANGAGAKDVCVWMGLDNNSLECNLATSDSGAFISDTLSPGSYIAAFIDFLGEYAIKYNGGTNDSASSTRVIVTAGQQTAAAGAALPLPGTITGTVTDKTSGAAPTRTICVADFSGDVPTVASSFVGDDGTFTIEQLPAGPHKVRFTDCAGSGTPYKEQFFNAKPDVGTADLVTVAAGADRPGVNAQMSTTEPTPGPTTTTTAGGTTTTTAGGTTTTTAGGTTTTTAGGATTTTRPPATTTTRPPTTTTATIPPTPPRADGPASSSQSTAQPGDSMTISGGGFRPGSTVTGVVYSTPVKLGEATANANGNVTLRFTLPTTLTPGRHELQLQGVNPAGGSRVLNAFFVIILPRTGGLAPWHTAAGATLLVLAAVARAARRRTNPLRP